MDLFPTLFLSIGYFSLIYSTLSLTMTALLAAFILFIRSREQGDGLHPAALLTPAAGDRRRAGGG